MKLVSDYNPGTYEDSMFKKFVELLPGLDDAEFEGELHIDFSRGATLPGLQVIKEEWQKLIKMFPEKPGTKTLIVEETVDPRTEWRFEIAIEKRESSYWEKDDYIIFTHADGTKNDVGLFVYLWSRKNELAVPIPELDEATE